MKQKLTATLGCLILSCALFAQSGTGWVDPVTFPANTNVCDPSPWKLVMYDNFDGNTLSSNWNRYITWDGLYVIRNNDTNNKVPKPNHADWSGSKVCKNIGTYHVVFKDENVQVNNGSCKILLKYDPGSTWNYVDSTNYNYPTGSFGTNYSTGLIATPIRLDNGTNNYFNSGKFEASVRFPDFKGAWCAFWLTFGAEVNEIDIAEMWGGVHPPLPGDATRTQFNLHAWGPDEASGQDNPLNLPRDAEPAGTGSFPGQEWYRWLAGTNFRTEYWHRYTCEWDTASIRSYVDGLLFNTFWKYGATKCVRGPRRGQYSSGTLEPGVFVVTVGSGCDLGGGNWNVTYGYPYSSNSHCHLRLSGGFGDNVKKPNNLNQPKIMGVMEVDNVKVWQKHPEKDGHTEICADNTYPATPTITGPNEVCGQVAYTLSPATTGTWSTFNSNILAVGTTSSSGADVAKDAGGAFNLGWVAFSYGNGIAECPPKTVYKRGLYCNRSTDWMVMTPYVLNNNGEAWVHFISDLYHKRDVSEGTTPVVTWNVSINRGQDSYDESTAENYTLYGQYASTPSLPAPDNGFYNIKWTMNVTDASGTWSRSGERNSRTRLMQQEADKHTYYLNAYIHDQDEYDATVYNSVASNMVSEEEYNDTLYVNEMIEKARADALEPYIITDGLDLLKGNNQSGLDKPEDEGGLTGLKSKLKVYPNPVQSNVTIIADDRFIDRQPITIHVYELAGKLIKNGEVAYNKGNIMAFDLSDVAAGNYILELQQGNVNEYVKITKTED